MTVAEPDMASVPAQAPLAVQDVAFSLVQVMVALCPGITELGVTLRVTNAGGGGVVKVAALVDFLPQPEKTKAERRSTTASKESDFLDSAGTCITPPFV
jgi:hypothetical protein